MSEEKNLSNVVNEIQKMEIDDLKEFSKKMLIVSDETQDISLNRFETYLLPYIIGELERNDVNTTVFFYNYKELAKSYRTSLQVRDNDKNIIYKLPPLIIGTNIDDLNNINFRYVISEISNIMENNPMKADMLTSKLTTIISDKLKLDGKDIEEFVTTIKQIFIDYKDRVKIKRIKETLVEDDIENDFLEY